MSTPEELLDIVGSVCGATREELAGPCRKQRLAEARIIFAFFAAVELCLSESQVGTYINRQHSTINYLKHQFENLYTFDAEFCYKADMVRLGLQESIGRIVMPEVPEEPVKRPITRQEFASRYIPARKLRDLFPQYSDHTFRNYLNNGNFDKELNVQIIGHRRYVDVKDVEAYRQSHTYLG